MEIAKSSYRIMVFSWNTESIQLCETLDTKVSETNHENISMNKADFLPDLIKFIEEKQPDLIVIGFQEDRYPGSYFHSHLLPKEMPKFGYGLVKRTKFMGVGITSYKGLLQGDIFERGIRISIYAKEKLISLIENEEKEMREKMADDGQLKYVCSSIITRSKGAIVSYIILPGFGRLAFICCHLPFNAKSLITERLYKNRMLRQTELNYSNICFNTIIDNLVLFTDNIPTHVIYFGDFNYRISDQRPANEIADEFIINSNNISYLKEMYLKHDELKEQMRRGNIYEFSEGKNNEGPLFLPTCKMVKGRKDNIYWKTGKQNQRNPSWCDRILYAKISNNDSSVLTCTYYDRFDVGNTMNKSDHAGILSLFVLS